MAENHSDKPKTTPHIYITDKYGRKIIIEGEPVHQQYKENI